MDTEAFVSVESCSETQAVLPVDAPFTARWACDAGGAAACFAKDTRAGDDLREVADVVCEMRGTPKPSFDAGCYVRRVAVKWTAAPSSPLPTALDILHIVARLRASAASKMSD